MQRARFTWVVGGVLLIIASQTKESRSQSSLTPESFRQAMKPGPQVLRIEGAQAKTPITVLGLRLGMDINEVPQILKDRAKGLHDVLPARKQKADLVVGAVEKNRNNNQSKVCLGPSHYLDNPFENLCWIRVIAEPETAVSSITIPLYLFGDTDNQDDFIRSFSRAYGIPQWQTDAVPAFNRPPTEYEYTSPQDERIKIMFGIQYSVEIDYVPRNKKNRFE